MPRGVILALPPVQCRATIRLQSTDGSRVDGSFELTFNPGVDQRTFTNGQIDADVDQNPAAEGLQSS